MNINRRDLLAGVGGVAATAAFNKLGAEMRPFSDAALAGAQMPAGPVELPRKEDFIIDEGYTYINAAYTHPIPKVSLEAARRAAESRGSLHVPATSGRGAGGRGGAGQSNNPKALFAELIGAKPTEIAYVPSTSFGENLVAQSLGLHKRYDGNVVSDGLHFEGALMHLLELGKRGLDVRIVKPTKDARIDMKDLERVVDKNTRLIEVSSAAMYNGFEHDLKAVSDLAHAHGAYVYADIIHSAGTGPFDITASGVDFAACSTFKWLMGDFGIGFLYARESVQDKIERPLIGYMEGGVEAFYPPNLPDSEYVPITYTLIKSAPGMFEPGTFGGGNVAAALLASSLNYVKSLGVENIKAHRQPMLKKLRQEVPRFGFTLVTPAESTGGNITFAKKDVGTSDLPRKLTAAKVNVRFSKHWMRLSPSVYNDMKDVDRFLEAMS
jgi:selenocysteine lyase/cysteine desulfurase